MKVNPYTLKHTKSIRDFIALSTGLDAHPGNFKGFAYMVMIFQ